MEPIVRHHHIRVRRLVNVEISGAQALRRCELPADRHGERHDHDTSARTLLGWIALGAGGWAALGAGLWALGLFG